MTMDADMANQDKFVRKRKSWKDIASAYFDSWLNVIRKSLFPQFDSFFMFCMQRCNFSKRSTPRR